MSEASPDRRSTVTENEPDLSGVAVAQIIKDALNRYIGPKKAVTPDELARDADVPRRQVTAWTSGEYCPRLPELLRVARALGDHGPAFLNEILAPIGLGGVERLNPNDAHPATLIAALVDEARQIAVALEDGIFCHRDKVAASRRLTELGQQIQEAAAAYGRLRAVK